MNSYSHVAVTDTGDRNGAIDEGINALNEQFIATPANTPSSSNAQPYLEVVAPATLQEGYTFDVEVNGHTFSVKVPVGGVEEGQKFNVPFSTGLNCYSSMAIPRASVPVGHWKDGLFDCFKLGVIHPLLWNARCCLLVALGQVNNRLKLTWLGNEGTIAQTVTTFRIFLLISLVHFVVTILVSLPDVNAYIYARSIFNFLDFLFWLFAAFLIIKTRNHIRSKYSIPEQNCRGCEDICCAFWCSCCTVAQMSRHTADYETYTGLCCSETGQGRHAPSIV